jgi:hypothetical protein
MNIFVTDHCPIQSARNLPDKHIVKMPLETCQMLAIIYSDWYYGVGKLHKVNGQPYATKRGAFRKHPCTIWAAAHYGNLSWLITHGLALCDEYKARYNKTHSCYAPMLEAVSIFEAAFDFNIDIYKDTVDTFTRAMPEYLKFDDTIDTITAYKRYLNTKPWLATNYLRIPSRKPSFIITTMTTTPNKSDLPVYDFSTTPEERAAEQANIDKAIEDAKAAMQVKQLEDSFKKEAPAVTKIKAKKLVPAKKAPAKAKGSKSGRVVGISADENKLLKSLLDTVLFDNNYATMISDNQIAFDKLIARYNKN